MDLIRRSIHQCCRAEVSDCARLKPPPAPPGQIFGKRVAALRGTKETQERRSSRTTHPDRRDVLPDLVAIRNCKSLKPSEPFFRSVNPLSLIVGIRSKTSKLR